MKSDIHKKEPSIRRKAKKAPWRRCILWKQYVEGDWNQLGNIIVEEDTSFRVMVDKARRLAAELKYYHAFVTPMTELNASNQGYGYQITEQPIAFGVPGEAYNILVSIEYISPDVSDPTFFSVDDDDVIYYEGEGIQGFGILEVLPDNTIVEQQ